MERESPIEEVNRKLREARAESERGGERRTAYELLIGLAVDELEAADAAYMELGNSEKAWAEFDNHAGRVCLNLKCIILELHKLAEISPSHPEVQLIRWAEETIDQITNIRINFWQKWGKKVKV